MFYVYPPTNMVNQRKLQKNNSDINKEDDLLLSSQIGGWVYFPYYFCVDFFRGFGRVRLPR